MYHSIPDYIDLHCDTAYELYHRKQSLTANSLAVSTDAAAIFPHYAQFFAVWSDKRLDDEEAYADFLAICDHFDRLVAQSDVMYHVRSAAELTAAWKDGKQAAFYAVEDARLLGGKIERLDVLAQRGVSYLTLGWSGKSCICASHDVPSQEDTGLSDFGRAVVERCFDLGIIPDISHASARTADDVLTLAERADKPILATHSDAYGVYAHTRNLHDDHFKRIVALGGLVGLNLYAHHLRCCDTCYATSEDVLPHIDHYLALGGEHHIAIGGDLDGADLPFGMKQVSDVACLAHLMQQHGYSDACIEGIFSRNAQAFIQKNLSCDIKRKEPYL